MNPELDSSYCSAKRAIGGLPRVHQAHGRWLAPRLRCWRHKGGSGSRGVYLLLKYTYFSRSIAILRMHGSIWIEKLATLLFYCSGPGHCLNSPKKGYPRVADFKLLGSPAPIFVYESNSSFNVDEIEKGLHTVEILAPYLIHQKQNAH